VLGSLFARKEKPRVFLGVLAVAPRTDWKRHFDEVGLLEDASLDTALRDGLTEIFSLPPVPAAPPFRATDLVLDVVIPKYQSGDAWDVSLGHMGFPVFWRPKVTVACRLYSVTTRKTKAIFSVTEKMTWAQYLSRIFTWRAYFRFRPVFDRKDMDYLLYQACGKLLEKMQKAI